MNNKLKSWLYIIGGIFIIGIVATLAMKLLFWLLPIIIVLYVIYKIKEYIDIKRGKKSNSNINYKSQSKSNYNNDFVGKVDDSAGEVIDVEYQDINK